MHTKNDGRINTSKISRRHSSPSYKSIVVVERLDARDYFRKRKILVKMAKNSPIYVPRPHPPSQSSVDPYRYPQYPLIAGSEYVFCGQHIHSWCFLMALVLLCLDLITLALAIAAHNWGSVVGESIAVFATFLLIVGNRRFKSKLYLPFLVLATLAVAVLVAAVIYALITGDYTNNARKVANVEQQDGFEMAIVATT